MNYRFFLVSFFTQSFIFSILIADEGNKDLKLLRYKKNQYDSDNDFGKTKREIDSTKENEEIKKLRNLIQDDQKEIAALDIRIGELKEQLDPIQIEIKNKETAKKNAIDRINKSEKKIKKEKKKLKGRNEDHRKAENKKNRAGKTV